MTRPVFIALTFVLLSGLGGCQSQLILMPTPELLKDERIDLFAINPEPMTSNEIRTLYITTRTPKDGSSVFFSGRPDNQLHFGYADLRIGEKNLNVFELIDQSTTGERKEKFDWTLLDAPILSSTARPAAEANGHAATDERPAALPSGKPPEELADYISTLNEHIDSNPIKELTIYVHGANNTFYWSVAQGAQFQYFTGDNAMALIFAWPSPGNIWSYRRDKHRADKAASDLAYAIELLSMHSTATRINLLGYSAGGRVIGGALAQLAERHPTGERLKIGHVYLTQSDEPLIDFVRDLPKFFPLVEDLTVTAAAGDPVLTMARATDFKLRLGAVGEGDGVHLDLSDEERQAAVDIMNSERMVLINLRDVPAERYHFTHGAWYESSWVSTDVLAALLGGYTPEERALVATDVNGVEIWHFPDDYIDRITRNVLNRNEENRQIQQPAQ